MIIHLPTTLYKAAWCDCVFPRRSTRLDRISFLGHGRRKITAQQTHRVGGHLLELTSASVCSSLPGMTTCANGFPSLPTGPTHVSGQLRSLLSLWRSSFPRSMRELGEEQTGGTLNFWTTAFETRTGALACEPHSVIVPLSCVTYQTDL